MQTPRSGKKILGPNNALFTMALVGSGRTWSMLATLFDRGEFRETFPWVRVCALVPGNEGACPDRSSFGEIPLYASLEELFANHPQLDLVCDLNEDGSAMARMRDLAPTGTALVTEETVYQFCHAAAAGAFVVGGGARLRRARDIFTTVIDQIDQDVIVINSLRRVVEVNSHFAERLGGDKVDYIGLGCDCLRLLDPAMPPSLDIFEEAREAGRPVSKRFSTIKEGRMRHYRAYAFPGSDRQSSRRVVLMVTDTTARVHLEQRLQQSEKMAAIGELSTYIAHEIRNPLFAIGGFANSLMRSSSLDDSAKEKVRIILDESRRLDAILTSIINFSRPMESVADGEVDTNAVVSRTVDILGIGGEQRNLAISLELAPELPMVQGDQGMLEQCLINLVKNAQEAMPEGGQVKVRSKLSGNRVLLQVADTGRGIPPELQERVFSPFFSTKDTGAGLGLAMTRKMVEEMGGSVYLSSKVGEGTTVTLTLLPVLDVTDEDHIMGHA